MRLLQVLQATRNIYIFYQHTKTGLELSARMLKIIYIFVEEMVVSRRTGRNPEEPYEHKSTRLTWRDRAELLVSLTAEGVKAHQEQLWAWME